MPVLHIAARCILTIGCPDGKPPAAGHVRYVVAEATALLGEMCPGAGAQFVAEARPEPGTVGGLLTLVAPPTWAHLMVTDEGQELPDEFAILDDLHRLAAADIASVIGEYLATDYPGVTVQIEPLMVASDWIQPHPAPSPPPRRARRGPSGLVRCRLGRDLATPRPRRGHLCTRPDGGRP